MTKQTLVIPAKAGISLSYFNETSDQVWSDIYLVFLFYKIPASAGMTTQSKNNKLNKFLQVFVLGPQTAKAICSK